MKLTKKIVLTLTDEEYDVLWQARYTLGKIYDLFIEDCDEDQDGIEDAADRGFKNISHILNVLHKESD